MPLAGWLLPVRAVQGSMSCSPCRVFVMPAVLAMIAGAGLGRCGGGGEGLAAPAAGPGWQAGCGAAGGVGLAGVPGFQDALVADGQQAGEPEHDRGQAREPGPAAGDVVAGRVLGGGEGPLGAGAPGVGLAVFPGRVVVLLA